MSNFNKNILVAMRYPYGKTSFVMGKQSTRIFLSLIGAILSTNANAQSICTAYNKEICQAVVLSKNSLKEEDLVWLRIIKAIQHIENPNANPKFISKTNDYGLMQIKPSTAFEECKKLITSQTYIDQPQKLPDWLVLGSPKDAESKLLNPIVNLFWGFLHLQRKLYSTQKQMDRYASCNAKIQGWEKFEYTFISYHLGSLKLDPANCNPLSGQDYGSRTLNLFRSEYDPKMYPACGFKTVTEFCKIQ